jgi:tetratricopeptide (TPR) repeat protein
MGKMGSGRRSPRLAILLVALLVAAPCSAQDKPSPSADATDNEASFQRGLRQYDEGDYAGAITTWEKLLAGLDEQRAWRLLFNLGLAHQAAGDATRAVERFEKYLQKVAQQPARLQPELEAKRVEVADRLRKIKAATGAVRVRPHPSRDVMVRIDQGQPRPTDFTAYLPPGEHVIEIRPGTPRVRRITVSVALGGSTDVDTSDPPAAPPTPPPASATPATSARTTKATSSSFPTGWLIAGASVTVLSTALPIGLGLVTKSKRDDATALGPGNTRYAAAIDDFHHARTAYEVSWILPAILAGATVAIVLLASGSPGSSGDARVGGKNGSWDLASF